MTILSGKASYGRGYVPNTGVFRLQATGDCRIVHRAGMNSALGVIKLEVL